MKFFEGQEFNNLARKMKNGDPGAAEKLYEKLFHKVYGFCMNRVSSKTVAEDITQDIFVKLVEKISFFDESRGNFLVWFWQVARNTVTDHYRKGKDIAFSDVSDETLEEKSSISAHEKLDYKIELEKIGFFINSMNPEDQELFNLRFVAGLTYREIAGVLGRSEGSLRVAISRLKSKVKRKFA
ncbi:MAG: sigma-70 family RNA polymerase sigma factor [Patescibacteria group bacterium]